MRTIFLSTAALGLAASPAVLASPTVTSLAKDGAWVANYDADSCQLIARFGTGDDAMIARFTRYQPGDGFDLALIGKGLKRMGTTTKAKISFGPGQPLREVEAILGSANETPMMLLNGQRLDSWVWPRNSSNATPPPISADQEAAITDFTVQGGGSRTFRLELGSMRRPMAEMRKCMDMLLESWGYDPKVVATLSRPVAPSNNPATWLTSNDYPSDALSKGQNGLVQFRLDVDEAGKILDCHVLARTRPDAFADLTCRLVERRARLLPALDAAGKPVKGYFITRVWFRVPN